MLSFEGLTDTAVNATPLILVGLAVGLGFKAGLFNIGGQGQFLVGALAAVGVGAALSNAVSSSHSRSLLAAVIAGSRVRVHPGRPQGIHRRA